MTFAPKPGARGGASDLYVAYGIYGDTTRTDNDHQVLLRYEPQTLLPFAKALDQNHMHTCGPAKPDGKSFVYTGPTHYGLQNLEYDAAHGYMMAAVYRGQKEQFPNYAMYFIDCSRGAERMALTGLAEQGDTLPLAPVGLRDADSGLYGSLFPLGATGMIALGGGQYYFSREFKNEQGHGSDVYLYTIDEAATDDRPAFVRVDGE